MGHDIVEIENQFPKHQWELIRHLYIGAPLLYKICTRCGKGRKITINIAGTDFSYVINLKNHEPSINKKT